jgi:hypothetical protein
VSLPFGIETLQDGRSIPSYLIGLCAQESRHRALFYLDSLDISSPA